ncbi:MAG: hypothetical protein HYT87_10235 [Nitrospirae bacterium]|nr:hypothetical protein [Nitrospirota bacterium]
MDIVERRAPLKKSPIRWLWRPLPARRLQDLIRVEARIDPRTMICAYSDKDLGAATPAAIPCLLAVVVVW